MNMGCIDYFDYIDNIDCIGCMDYMDYMAKLCHIYFDIVYILGFDIVADLYYCKHYNIGCIVVLVVVYYLVD